LDRLTKADPGNAKWQRDLAVSWGMIGITQMAQGDLTDALKSFQDGLVVFERLVKSDPGNAEWQRDLAVSYAKLADAYRKSDDPAKARDALTAGRVIVAKLAEEHPDWAQWKKDLAWFDDQIAELKTGAVQKKLFHKFFRWLLKS
jgi:hypothetical protein